MGWNMKVGSSKIKFMIVFGLPTFILYFTFFIYPAFESIRVSFFKWSGFTPTMEYLGLRNYLKILSDDIFINAIKNDFIIVFGKELIIVVLSVLFAVSLTRLRFSKEETGFYRFVFFFPNVLSVIVIATLWSFVLHPTMGVLNGLLKSIGLERSTHAWLGEYETVIPSIIAIASWAGIGLFMIVLIAAINNVPMELYESAKIDGAGEWVQLFKITLPMIWHQMQFVIITILYQTLGGNFGLIMPLTNGGPDNASQVMGLYVYQLGIQNNRVGYANAAAVILLAITVTISLISKKLLSRDIGVE